MQVKPVKLGWFTRDGFNWVKFKHLYIGAIKLKPAKYYPFFKV